MEQLKINIKRLKTKIAVIQTKEKMRDIKKNNIIKFNKLQLSLQNKIERLKTVNSILKNKKNVLKIKLALNKEKEKQTDITLLGMAALNNKV